MQLLTAFSCKIDAVVQWQKKQPLAKTTLALVGGVLLLWASAKMKVPFAPVPQTFQVFVLFALSAFYGKKIAPLTVGSYLMLGALGLPVFANTPEQGIGLMYMFGPTGGYLLGFLVASLWIGFWSDKVQRFTLFSAATIFTSALLIVYTLGLLWLSVFVGPESALQYGFFPFVVSDLLKIGLLALLAPKIKPAFWLRKR